MTLRELVIKTLNHEPAPRVPRDLWIPASEEAGRADELAEMGLRFPSDIVRPDGVPAHAKKAQSKSSKAEEFTDLWGCVWQVGAPGSPPELKHSPLSDLGKVASYQPPAELLERSRFARVNKSCLATNRFVLAWSEVRPFDRLRFLRGSEAALVDLAGAPKRSAGCWPCSTRLPVRSWSFGPTRRWMASCSATIGARPTDC